MSQDSRKNDDLFPDWEFSEPDWLKEDPISFTKESPAEPAQPASVREPASPKNDPDPFWDSPRPQVRPEPVRHSSSNASWEQTRSSGRSRQSTPPRRTAPPSKKREQSRRNPLVIVLIVILIGGMIFAGWQLGSILLGYQRDRSAYDQLATSALISIAEPENNQPAVSTPSAQFGEESVETDAPQGDAAPSEIPFTVDWDYLASVNPDIVGWLYCPDTVINYPVVQSEDHEYYLKHGFEGQSNSSGTLFADRDSVAGITQSHFIIYGHNMKDNSMFGILRNYTDRSYYEDHPIFYYLTPDGCYRVELICAMTVESVLSNFPTYFSSTSDYQSYLDRITSGAYWVNSSAVSTNYQLMTFSTCTYGSGYTDARLLVHGMMIPIE